jgi:hypothetical protein
LGISISVSISMPERLGNRRLKFASQSSPGLVGFCWREGLRSLLVPGLEASGAPTRRFLGFGGAAGGAADRDVGCCPDE